MVVVIGGNWWSAVSGEGVGVIVGEGGGRRGGVISLVDIKMKKNPFFLSQFQSLW
jgi:hypothetical protein